MLWLVILTQYVLVAGHDYVSTNLYCFFQECWWNLGCKSCSKRTTTLLPQTLVLQVLMWWGATDSTLFQRGCLWCAVYFTYLPGKRSLRVSLLFCNTEFPAVTEFLEIRVFCNNIDTEIFGQNILLQWLNWWRKFWAVAIMVVLMLKRGKKLFGIIVFSLCWSRMLMFMFCFFTYNFIMNLFFPSVFQCCCSSCHTSAAAPSYPATWRSETLWSRWSNEPIPKIRQPLFVPGVEMKVS